MEEVWKDIPGYEGRYMVSSFGGVLSLNYCGRGYSRKLVPKCNNKGRLWVELVLDKKRTPYLIHRLVASVFIPNPNGYPQINHLDENPKNNQVDNLEWCTQAYNNQYYRDRHPTKPKQKSEPIYSRQRDKKIAQSTKEGELIRVWDNSRQIAKKLGFSDWSISECCRGKRKTAYGFIWRYAN